MKEAVRRRDIDTSEEELLASYVSAVDALFMEFRRDWDLDFYTTPETIDHGERMTFARGEERQGDRLPERQTSRDLSSAWRTNRGEFVLHVTPGGRKKGGEKKLSTVWLEVPSAQIFRFGTNWRTRLLEYLKGARIIHRTA